MDSTVILQNSCENVYTFNEKYDFLSDFLLINEEQSAQVQPLVGLLLR